MSNQQITDFFVAGGTLPPDTPSYVTRQADDELLKLVQGGTYCYVLTPRQMGKSSLMSRTAAQLKQKAVSTAIIDLTGSGTVSVEQWYFGLLKQLKDGLLPSQDLTAWWKAHDLLGPMQRFKDFLRDVVLKEIEGPVVIFVDEIDKTLDLEFSDDFFTAIRAMYNARAHDPEFNRLTFVLLGVASPPDLIKKRTQTPFNIGQRITLEEFSQPEATVLQEGLEAVYEGQGEAIFGRIYYWTSGYPYLTQKLCFEIAEREQKDWTDQQIDALVGELFLSEAAVREETHLQFIQDRILDSPQRRRSLNLYSKVYEKNQEVADDPQSTIQNQLKLSGLVKAENGSLSVRNPIYHRVFNLQWVKENTQIDWFRLVGQAATVIISLLVVLVIGCFSYNFWADHEVATAADHFRESNKPEEQARDLLKICQLERIGGSKGYDDKARILFYGLPEEQQLALLKEGDLASSDLIVVIKDLYVSLANINGTDTTSSILDEMLSVLSQNNEAGQADNLIKEIDAWLKGRELAQQNNYSDARDYYDTAIKFNGDNPATLYERARVLARLFEYEKAFSDLDELIAKAKPTSNPILAFLSTDSFTASLTSHDTPVTSFITTRDMIDAVGNLIDTHSGVNSFLIGASNSALSDQYANLWELKLVSSSSPSLSPDSSTALRILTRGVLRAGVKYDTKPFGYLNEDQQVVGFDVDMVKEFARRWLGDENAVQLQQVTSSDRIPRLASGQVDLVVATMTQTKARDELIDFSQTYFLDGQSLLVRKSSGINNVADLNRKRVAAVEGSTSIDNILAEARGEGTTVNIRPFGTFSQAVEALKARQVDAFTSDSGILSQFAQDNPDLQLVGERFTQEPYGIGLPQGDSDFRELVNFTVQQMKSDGTYDRIYQKWFLDEPYPIEIVPGESPYPTLVDLPAQVAQPTRSRIEEILDKQQIVVGVTVDFKPFGFRDQNDQIVGFDIDLVSELAKRWLDSKQENTVEFIPITSENAIPYLVNGKVDLVVASMTHTREWDELIDFSQTYFSDKQALLVRQGYGISHFAHLDNRKVAVIKGSTSISQIQTVAHELQITIDDQPFDGYSQAFEALMANEVNALITASETLSQRAENNPELHVLDVDFPDEPYGIGLPKNDYRFRELVNFTLQEMKDDGTYDSIYRNWFGTNQPYLVEILPGDADYLAISYNSQDLHIIPNVSIIERIRERDTLIAGVKYDFKPFGFIDDNSQVVGFDVDLIQAIADEWGVEVQFVQATSADRIPRLTAGEVHIIAASMTHRKDRDESIDFSQTYFLDGQSLLVRKDSGIEGIQDLEGKIVTAIAGSTSIDQIQAYADANDVRIEIIPFQEYPPALEALKAEQVDALTTHSVALYQFAKDNPELQVVGGLFTQESYGMGLPPGDSYFNNLVNFTLQNLKEDGTYDQIYKKWFGEDAIPYSVEIMPGERPYTFATPPTALDKPIQSKVDEKILTEQCGFIAGVKYDFPPFGFVAQNGQVVGFDVDIVKEFAKRWCGDENKVELVKVTSSNRIPKLAADEVDIVVASMTHKKERDEMIDFSQSYFLDGQSLLVRKESDVNELTDLDGKTVSAIEGTTSIDNIQAIAEKLGITIDVVAFLEYGPALEALKDGQVDALTTDSMALSQFAKENPELIVVGGRFTREPYGIGVPNYDDRFRDLVNFTLQEMKVDGTYDRLYQKWFGDDSEPYNVEIWPGESYLIINTVPMLRIPVGEFIRGSNDGFPNEAPQQTIFLDEFYIDQYEVTNYLYAQCVIAGGCNLPQIQRAVSSVEYFASPAFRNHPVVWVTWQDAQTYCQFAGKRLPTEAEWEKAARGTDGTTYPWGEEEPTAENKQANFIGGGHIDTFPVGSHPAGVSPYGVHDMAGNVREWVADWSQHDYYQNAPQENPPGPDNGITKVVRGGAWNDSASELTTTRRKDFLPDSFDGGLGFRCASSTFPPTR